MPGGRAYLGQGHPWADFLHHRKVVIHFFFGEGKTPDEIARVLSMDGDQVLLIAMSTAAEMDEQPGGSR